MCTGSDYIHKLCVSTLKYSLSYLTICNIILCVLQIRVFTFLIGREVGESKQVKWMACANKGEIRVCVQTNISPSIISLKVTVLHHMNRLNEKYFTSRFFYKGTTLNCLIIPVIGYFLCPVEVFQKIGGGGGSYFFILFGV